MVCPAMDCHRRAVLEVSGDTGVSLPITRADLKLGFQSTGYRGLGLTGQHIDVAEPFLDLTYDGLGGPSTILRAALHGVQVCFKGLMGLLPLRVAFGVGLLLLLGVISIDMDYTALRVEC